MSDALVGWWLVEVWTRLDGLDGGLGLMMAGWQLASSRSLGLAGNGRCVPAFVPGDRTKKNEGI